MEKEEEKKEANAGPPLRCLTWNIGTSKRQESLLEFGERMRFVVQRLLSCDYDVICLQEVELKRGNRKTGATHFEALTKSYAHAIHEPSDLSLRIGNMTLWRAGRFELVQKAEKAVRLLSEGREPVKVVYTRLADHATEEPHAFSLMNMHLKAGLYQFAERRVNELRCCLSLLPFMAEDDPLCLCGDFNDNLQTFGAPDTSLASALHAARCDASPDELATCCVFNTEEQRHKFWAFDRVATRNCSLESAALGIDHGLAPFPNAHLPTDHVPLEFVLRYPL